MTTAIDDDDDERARPACRAGTPFYMTPAGHAAFAEELRRLWYDERPKVVEIVSWAAGLGDRSENADYQYGKRRLREIDRRVRFIRKRLERVQVVDPAAQAKRDTGLLRRDGHLCAGGRPRGAPSPSSAWTRRTAPPARISWVSPVARALLGAQVGDLVRLRTPQGVESIEIVAIRYPER